jgi:hypothetical protein
MTRVKAEALPFVAMLFFLCGQSAKPPTSDAQPGLIEGTITYEDGTAARGATVYASPMGRPFGGIIPHATADERGHFAILHLWLGPYAVGAEKLDEDYPNNSEQFYSGGKFKTVTLTVRRSAATISIHLGPKAGILTGTVVDAVTGAPLNSCAEFRWANGPDNFLSGTGLVNAKYRMLIPSNTPILMKVWYRGHKRWYYPGTTDKTHGLPVNLKPGEQLRVDIRLEPDPSAPPADCGMPVGTVIQP